MAIVMLMISTAICHASDAGRLCLAPVPKPTPGPKSLANPTGGDPTISYSVQIDGDEWTDLSYSGVTWISNLDLDKRHLVVVRGDGVQIESFYFKFNRDEPDLCLFLKSLYQKWILWPVGKTGDWCPCYASEKTVAAG